MSRSLTEVMHLVVAAGWRWRFLIAVPLVLLPPVGFAIGVIAPRTYETQMTVMVQEPAKQSPYLGDFTVGTRLQERMPVLSSLVHNSILEDVVVDLGLVSEHMSRVERDEVIARLSKGLTMKLTGTDLVELRLRSNSPVRLDQQLGQIGKHFIEKLTLPERSSIAGSIEFLEGQVASRGPLVKAAETRLAEFKARNSARLPEVRSANVVSLTELRKTLNSHETELAGANARLAELQTAAPRNSPVLDELDKEIAQLFGEITQLQAKYTERHPHVRALQRELEALEAQRERLGSKSATAGRITSPDVAQFEAIRLARAEQMALQVQVTQLKRALAEVEQASSDQTDVQAELTRLETALGTEQEIYDKLVKRLEMARVTGDLASFEASERVKIIAPPNQPAVAMGVSPELFPIAGIVCGLALGIGLSIAAEFADDSIRRRSDLERIAGVPVLARLPQLADDPAAVRGEEAPVSPASPACRSSQAGNNLVTRPVVVQVVQELTPGGIQVMVLELARHLAHEFDVHVVSLEGTGASLRAAWSRAAAIGRRLHALNKGPDCNLRTVLHLTRLVRSLKPVAVHTHHIGPLLYGGLAARLAGVRRLVHTEHDAWHFAAPRHRDLERLALAAFRPRLIADADIVAAALTRAIPASRPHVIMNGIDTAHFSPGDQAAARRALNLPLSSPVVGTAGRLEPVKDQALLIRAFARLRTDTVLAIAGDGSLRANLEQLAVDLGLQHRVHFLGHCDDMPTFYGALDVFCLPSQAEGLPLALLEAQACGVAAVATDVGAVREVLAPGASLAVPAHDEGQLAHALSQVIGARSTCNPREFVRQRYDAVQMVQAYRGFFFA